MTIEKGNIRKVDLNYLSRFAKPNAIRDFYMSPNYLVQRFLERESSFYYDGFILAVCISGTGVLKINGQEYELCAGSLLLISPNQLLEQYKRSEDFTRCTIVFTLDLLLDFPSPMDFDLIHIARRRPILYLSPGEMNHIMEYYRFLDREYDNLESPYRDCICRALLNAMLLKVIGLYEIYSDKPQNEGRQRQEQLADDFFRLMSQYYKSNRTVAFYAGKMHRTPKYLSGEIKRITGRSILEWLNEAILIEMKLQLKTTNNTILQISEELNFSSPSAFVQFFKRHTGQTPSGYRNSF